jgi:hypothetical protein
VMGVCMDPGGLHGGDLSPRNNKANPCEVG